VDIEDRREEVENDIRVPLQSRPAFKTVISFLSVLVVVVKGHESVPQNIKRQEVHPKSGGFNF